MKGATVDDVSAGPSRESLATIRSGVEFPRCGGIQGEQRRTGVDGCSPEMILWMEAPMTKAPCLLKSLLTAAVLLIAPVRAHVEPHDQQKQICFFSPRAPNGFVSNACLNF